VKLLLEATPGPTATGATPAAASDGAPTAAAMRFTPEAITTAGELLRLFVLGALDGGESKHSLCE
jgi:hypothetical protein